MYSRGKAEKRRIFSFTRAETPPFPSADGQSRRKPNLHAALPHEKQRRKPPLAAMKELSWQ
jgi:hypothetical protein